MSRKHIPRFMMTDISKTIINKPTYISNIIKEVSDKGGDQSKVISTLATLPADTLKKAIKENENIYIYHKEGKRTLRYFSRFFRLDSKEHTITIDYPYVDGYTHKYLEAGDAISVVFHTAGFRFHFDTKVKEKVTFPTGKGIKSVHSRSNILGKSLTVIAAVYSGRLSIWINQLK